MFERAEFRRHLEAAGIDESHLERLAEFGAMLLEANRRFNLTGAKTAEQLAPHIVDSLSVALYVRGPYVDIGSGGGLPAIPLAIVTGAEVTLIESVVKKTVFLKAALADLGLSGRVIPERAEHVAQDPEFRERFQSGTARAVSSPSTVAELLVPFLALGGRAILQRGAFPQSERDALADAAMMLGARVSEERELEGDRRIVLLEKTEPTPQRFPRRAGIPEKRPLCT